jgi:hypothetical protein
MVLTLGIVAALAVIAAAWYLRARRRMWHHPTGCAICGHAFGHHTDCPLRSRSNET